MKSKAGNRLVKALCAFVPLCLCVASSAVPSARAASPAATQAWVKKYVAEHGGVSPDAVPEKQTSEFSAQIDGITYTLQINYAVKTPGLQVLASSNSLLAAGTCFPKTAEGLYQNVTNSGCNAINVVKRLISRQGTNYYYRTAAEFRVGDSVYGGLLDGDKFSCTNGLESGGVILLGPCSLFPDERDAALTPLPSVSWLSLFFGSAFAAWIPGEWIKTGELLRIDGDGTEWYRQKRHYTFSGGGAVPVIRSVTFTQTNGNAWNVPLGGLNLPSLPGDGTDKCEYDMPSFDNLPSIKTGIKNALVSVLQDEGGMTYASASAVATAFMAAQGDSVYSDVIAKLANVQAALDGAPSACPEEGEYPIEPNYICYDERGYGYKEHGAPTGECGNWSCSRCGTPLPDGPQSHIFPSLIPEECRPRCNNVFRGARCPARDENVHKIVSGSKDGCICAEGLTWPHRDPVPYNDFGYDDDFHWGTLYCRTCVTIGYYDKEPHIPSGADFAYDCKEDGCHRFDRCTVCNVEDFEVGVVEHVKGSRTSVVSVGDEGHQFWYACDRSGIADRVKEPTVYKHQKKWNGKWEDCEDGTHAKVKVCSVSGCDWEGEVDKDSKEKHQDSSGGKYESVGSSGHVLKQTCTKCKADMTDYSDIESHTDGKWNLIDNWGAQDELSCAKNCGYVKKIPHTVAYDDKGRRYCSNGGGHLFTVVCPHENAVGYCGAWKCAACGADLPDGPASHNYDESQCNPQCSNTYKGGRCVYSLKDHHVFTGKGDDEGCLCQCGQHHEHQAPEGGGVSEWNNYTHSLAYTCTRCGHEVTVWQEPHRLGETTYDCSAAGCYKLVKCPLCPYEFPRENVGHLKGGLTSCTDGTDAGHIPKYACLNSGKPDMITGERIPHTRVEQEQKRQMGDLGHMTLVLCADDCGWPGALEDLKPHSPGEKEDGPHDGGSGGHYWNTHCTVCDYYPVKTPLEGHTLGDWTLVDDWDAHDYKECTDGCGHTEKYEHSLEFDNIKDGEHWCANGGGHLRGNHVCNATYGVQYSREDGVNGVTWIGPGVEYTCQSCGFSTVEPDAVGLNWYCNNCSCNDSGDSNDCKHPRSGRWDDGTEKAGCGCSACENGEGCLCCGAGIVGSEMKITSPTLNGLDGTSLLTFQTITSLNGDDPVYYIAANALLGACAGLQHLEIVRFNYVTNMGIGACMDAFRNCPALTNVQFSSLLAMPEHGFDGAFWHCGSLSNIAFESVGEIAAYGFADNDIANVYFPVATNIADTAFAGCDIGTLRLGSLTTYAVERMNGGGFFGLGVGTVIECADGSITVPDPYDGVAIDPDCDFYVSPDGSDHADGLTVQTAFRTIDRAMHFAETNSVVGILPGRYAWPDFFSSAGNTTIPRYHGSAFPVTVKAAGGRGTAVFVYSEKADHPGHNVVFRGYTPDDSGMHSDTATVFDGFRFHGWGYRYNNTGLSTFAYLWFKNCDFYNPSVSTNNSSGTGCATWLCCLFDNCTVEEAHIAGLGGNGSYWYWDAGVFYACELSDCILNIERASPEAGNLRFAKSASFDNCFLNLTGAFESIACKCGGSYTFDYTTVLCDGNASGGEMPGTRALVGMDGFTPDTSAMTECFATNRAAATAMIDQTTRRVEDSTLPAYGYGYGSKPQTRGLLLKGGMSGGTARRMVLRIPAKPEESETDNN